jgi:hypothetical protein
VPSRSMTLTLTKGRESQIEAPEARGHIAGLCGFDLNRADLTSVHVAGQIRDSHVRVLLMEVAYDPFQSVAPGPSDAQTMTAARVHQIWSARRHYPGVDRRRRAARSGSSPPYAYRGMPWSERVRAGWRNRSLDATVPRFPAWSKGLRPLRPIFIKETRSSAPRTRPLVDGYAECAVASLWQNRAASSSRWYRRRMHRGRNNIICGQITSSSTSIRHRLARFADILDAKELHISWNHSAPCRGTRCT